MEPGCVRRGGAVLRRGAGGRPAAFLFDRNIDYVNEWFAFKNEYKPVEGDAERSEAKSAPRAWRAPTARLAPRTCVGWERHLPASSEGRMLGAAATRCAGASATTCAAIVDTVVAMCQGPAARRRLLHAVPEEEMDGRAGTPGTTSARNYDRVNLTRGMVAAAQCRATRMPTPSCASSTTGCMRRRTARAAGRAVRRPAGSGAHNCNNGHEGSLLMHFSPVGKPEDLVAVERYFVQDFFIEASRQARSR